MGGWRGEREGRTELKEQREALLSPAGDET